jgi:predicted nicotinamide N-methyase
MGFVTKDMHNAEGFIAAHTQLTHAPLVPEIALFLATEITPIWQASEAWLAAHDLPPPYWAFAWPGGQALARHILDNRELVAGRRVLDFAAGCGLAAIACAKAGAAQVVAAEIDGFAAAAIRLNAAQNDTGVDVLTGDVVGRPTASWDLILCGDVCYEAPMTRHILPWLQSAAQVSEVWIADPGRAYLPKDGLSQQAVYSVPTTLELEDRTNCNVTLFRLL